MFNNYQQAVLRAEYSMFAHVGNVLSALQVFPKLRVVLCKYRISLLDKQIELCTKNSLIMQANMEVMRDYLNK